MSRCVSALCLEGINLLPDLTDIAPCYYFSDEVTEAVVVAAGQTVLSAAGAAPQAARHPLLARQVGREHLQIQQPLLEKVENVGMKSEWAGVQCSRVYYFIQVKISVCFDISPRD